MNTDTTKLLRECNAGIKMGIDTIESVLERVENQDFYAILKTCKDEHIKLGQKPARCYRNSAKKVKNRTRLQKV